MASTLLRCTKRQKIRQYRGRFRGFDLDRDHRSDQSHRIVFAEQSDQARDVRRSLYRERNLDAFAITEENA